MKKLDYGQMVFTALVTFVVIGVWMLVISLALAPACAHATNKGGENGDRNSNVLSAGAVAGASAGASAAVKSSVSVGLSAKNTAGAVAQGGAGGQGGAGYGGEGGAGIGHGGNATGGVGNGYGGNAQGGTVGDVTTTIKTDVPKQVGALAYVAPTSTAPMLKCVGGAVSSTEASAAFGPCWIQRDQLAMQQWEQLLNMGLHAQAIEVRCSKPLLRRPFQVQDEHWWSSRKVKQANIDNCHAVLTQWVELNMLGDQVYETIGQLESELEEKTLLLAQVEQTYEQQQEQIKAEVQRLERAVSKSEAISRNAVIKMEAAAKQRVQEDSEFEQAQKKLEKSFVRDIKPVEVK